MKRTTVPAWLNVQRERIKRTTVPAWLKWGLSALLVAIAVVIVVVVLDIYVAPYKPTDRTALIQTFAQIAGAFGLVATLILTVRQLAATNRSLEISRDQLVTTREGQITERFTRAIEQFGDSSAPLQLGGIYALERIARDSERDHWPVMEILTAYVRDHAPVTDDQYKPGFLWPSPTVDAQAVLTDIHQTSKPSSTIEAILRVLGRRERRHETDEQRLDLHRTNLRWAALRGAHLEKTLLWGSFLDGADLTDVRCEGADISDGHFRLADLTGSHLENATLPRARFEGANLTDVHCEGANLIRAHFEPLLPGPGPGTELFGAHLEGTSLRQANLQQANLSEAHLNATAAYPHGADLTLAKLDRAVFRGAHLLGANFQGAITTDTDFRGVDLRGVLNLTQAQVDAAQTDPSTQLPPGLALPTPTKGASGP